MRGWILQDAITKYQKGEIAHYQMTIYKPISWQEKLFVIGDRDMDNLRAY